MRVFQAKGIYVKNYAGELFVPLEIGKVNPEFGKMRKASNKGASGKKERLNNV